VAHVWNYNYATHQHELNFGQQMGAVPNLVSHRYRKQPLALLRLVTFGSRSRCRYAFL